jgi:hypothetical protein
MLAPLVSLLNNQLLNSTVILPITVPYLPSSPQFSHLYNEEVELVLHKAPSSPRILCLLALSPVVFSLSLKEKDPIMQGLNH